MDHSAGGIGTIPRLADYSARGGTCCKGGGGIMMCCFGGIWLIWCLSGGMIRRSGISAGGGAIGGG